MTQTATTGSSQSAIDNPLAGIQVGSRVMGETGKIFAPVLNEDVKITRFSALPSTKFRLTGVSAFLNSSEMNQGSLSISGSYGVSGVSKVSSALTIYAAKATSQSTKTISLSMNCIKWAGVEYIDFDNLDVAALVSSLSIAARTELLNVLTCFQNLHELTKGMSKADFVTALQDTTPTSAKIRKAFESWATASEQFRSDFGSGVVAAVLWGGWGSVTAVIKSQNNQMHWTAGGSGSFEYQGDGADVKISASYGHQEDIVGSNATADIQGSSNGGCVEDMVSVWWTSLSAAATQGLAAIGEQPIQNPDASQTPIGSPNISPFKTPPGSTDPALAGLTQIYTSLAMTSTLAMLSNAAAWHSVKSSKSLSEFTHNAGKPSHASAAFPVDVTASIMPTIKTDVLDVGHFGLRSVVGTPLDILAQSSHEGSTGAEFEPMGIWIADWTELFPWLCSGRHNALPKTGTPQLALTLKIMYQDLITLSSLYWRYASSGITCPDGVNLTEISDDFSARAEELAQFIANDLPTAGVKQVKAQLQNAVNGLSQHANAIYQVWDRMGFLRLANLGLGITLDLNVPGLSGVRYQTINSIAGTYQFNFVPSEYDETKLNHAVFAESVKASPLVLPNGEVYLFLMGFSASGSSDQDYSGLLSLIGMDPDDTNHWLELSKDTNDSQLTFTDAVTNEVTGEKKLVSDGKYRPDFKGYISAYPLPFDAARGVQWRGCSVSTGLGDLTTKVQDMCSSLDKLPAWSLDSDYWTSDTLKTTFNLARIHLSYVGVVDEPNNILPSAQSTKE